MNEMSIEEMKAMVGTEFTYNFGNTGDSIRAFVAKFDERVGLTCLAIDDETVQGHKLNHARKDGIICLISIRRSKYSMGQFCANVSNRLTLIKETGQFTTHGGGTAVCAF